MDPKENIPPDPVVDPLPAASLVGTDGSGDAILQDLISEVLRGIQAEAAAVRNDMARHERILDQQQAELREAVAWKGSLIRRQARASQWCQTLCCGHVPDELFDGDEASTAAAPGLAPAFPPTSPQDGLDVLLQTQEKGSLEGEVLMNVTI
mmetsp:Transcript_36288/g.96445  ORF Transcript_36288/g.96445 Transcript_36288/m.96445 type:complete len:151 (-) Transcript_36288:106-558(-)